MFTFKKLTAPGSTNNSCNLPGDRVPGTDGADALQGAVVLWARAIFWREARCRFSERLLQVAVIRRFGPGTDGADALQGAVVLWARAIFWREAR